MEMYGLLWNDFLMSKIFFFFLFFPSHQVAFSFLFTFLVIFFDWLEAKVVVYMLSKILNLTVGSRDLS